jgi:hypothetical protein
MRAILGATRRVVIATALLMMGAGLAQAAETSSYQNNSQFGMNLPQAVMPSGQDEIRTSDGTSCRSSVGGNGTYMDLGVLGTPESDNINASAAAYGRVVIPLGYQAQRLDCNQLYQLEIQRLKMELEMAKMGIGGKTPTEEAALTDNWANDGWGNEGNKKKSGKESEKKDTSSESDDDTAAVEDGPPANEIVPPASGKKKAFAAKTKPKKAEPVQEDLSVEDFENMQVDPTAAETTASADSVYGAAAADAAPATIDSIY